MEQFCFNLIIEHKLNTDMENNVIKHIFEEKCA